MKKIIILIIALFSLSINAYAEEYITEDSSFTYTDTVKSVQEAMKAFYMRGPYLQYNYARANYGTINPEDATSQNIEHLVCASYTYSTYVEAFGVNGVSQGFPRYNYDIVDQAREYYQAGENLNGNYLIMYTTKNNAVKYIHSSGSDADLITNFAASIQPGDLFAYTGHAMIAYQVVERTASNGTKFNDVLMLNSTVKPRVRTRDNGYTTSDINYNFFASSYGTNGIIDIDYEGTVKYFWLSENTHLVDTSVSDLSKRRLSCNMDECAVIRPYYKVGTNGVKFNYPMLKSKYSKSILRTEYPGLYIEKTVNKIDKNDVYLRDRLVYTIEIVNKSKLGTANGVTYNKFAIVEAIDKSLVKYVSSTSGSYDENTGKITFKINDNLKANQKITLTYTVDVIENNENIGKTIVSNGLFHKLNGSTIETSTGIFTGKVENIIVAPTKKNTENKTISECYNQNKGSGQKGLALIDQIYDCYYGNKLDVDFTDFNLSTFIAKNDPTNRASKNVVTISENLDSNSKKINDMILNNYWGGKARLSSPVENDKYYYIIPFFGSSDTRNKYIDYHHFEEGDVLIYSIDYSQTRTDNYTSTEGVPSVVGYSKYKHTDESGTYAFIYINGEFVGVNGSNATTRNKFTYEYYCTNNHSTTDYTCRDTCLMSDNYDTCNNGATNTELSNIYAHLYTSIRLIDGTNDADKLSKRKEVLKIANYQTIYDKDYYVILRPSKLVRGENAELTFTNTYQENNNILRINKFSSANAELSLSSLLGDVTTNGTVTVKNKELQDISSNDSITTGYTFNDTFSEKITYPVKSIDYKIIIMGDTLSEGKVTNNGIKATARHIVDGNVLTEDGILAADVDNNGKVKMNDVVRMIIQEKDK